jgi:hypothetical protein
VLQAPYRDIAAQRGVEPTGVYVSFFAFGSPASRYGLYAGRRITAVDGIPVADLDAFLELVRGKRDRESVRLTTVIWNGQTEVLTLKLDDTYWPGYEVVWVDGEWRRRPLPGPAVPQPSSPQDERGAAPLRHTATATRNQASMKPVPPMGATSPTASGAPRHSR